MMRRGFTLLELVFALLLSAVVLLAASTMLSALQPLSRGIVAFTEISEAEALAWTDTREAIQMMEPAPQGAVSFSGSSQEASFGSRCLQAGGWLKRCSVTLRLVKESTGVYLTSTTSLGRGWRLSLPAPAEFQYRLPLIAGAGWVREWRDELLLPTAVAIAGPDTLVFLVGLP